MLQQLDRAEDGSEDSDKEMMELMARNGSILSPSDAKKRRLQQARSRPMPKAARMKLEMKMEPAVEEGPDSDEEMMALLDPGRSGIPSTENRKVQQIMGGGVNGESDSDDDVASMVTEGWGNRETR